MRWRRPEAADDFCFDVICRKSVLEVRLLLFEEVHGFGAFGPQADPRVFSQKGDLCVNRSKWFHVHGETCPPDDSLCAVAGLEAVPADLKAGLRLAEGCLERQVECPSWLLNEEIGPRWEVLIF